jgi:hypothetical protein
MRETLPGGDETLPGGEGVSSCADVPDCAGLEVLEALRSAHAALDTVIRRDECGEVSGWLPLKGLSSAELAEVVRLQASLEARVAGMRLHAVAVAEHTQAKAGTGASDTPAWAAAASNRPRSWGSLGLARSLEEKYHHVSAALARGEIGEDHARIIVRACEAVGETLTRLDREARLLREEAERRGLSADQIGSWLPEVPTITDDELAACEQRLVQRAREVPPHRLRRHAIHVLAPLRRRVTVLLPDSATLAVDSATGEVDLDALCADDQLRGREHRAERDAWFDLHDNGDGTWSGRLTLPELHAHLLKNWLEHYSSPRRAHHRRATSGGEAVVDVTVVDAGLIGPVQRTHAERMGDALCELLEHLPTETTDDQLAKARFGTNGVTLVVHVDEHTLRTGLGTATLDTGSQISAAQARRLACEAGILPLVLGGDSMPLDLGRTQRLFTRHQALALSATHDSCAAEGCDRPFAWCELHHLRPWSADGPTDLDNAVPLCGHHHRRIHDPLYHWQLNPDGTITFQHRWPSRRRRVLAA